MVNIINPDNLDPKTINGQSIYDISVTRNVPSALVTQGIVSGMGIFIGLLMVKGNKMRHNVISEYISI